MKKHILVVIAQNKPGVLQRVTSLCRKRLVNIESLTAGHIEKEGYSHMTLVFDATKVNVEQMNKQLAKLIDVVEVKELEYDESLKKELAFFKLEITPETRSELLQIAETFDTNTEYLADNEAVFSLTAHTEKIDEFIKAIDEFGIKEVKRTGIIAMEK